MVIDFHTHVFPDGLAEKAMQELAAAAGDDFHPVSDGTVSGLLQNMDDWNIDISVIQPVLTKQSQFIKANEWSAEIESERLICFGGLYPHTDDYKRDIDFILSLGFKGLKFHPEYQNFVVDDKRALRIYDYALSKGLALFIHAGYDSAFEAPFRSSPQQFARIDREMRGGVIVAAHLGGCREWDAVEEHLAGSGIYFDTSMGFDFFSKEQFLRIWKKHGTDKILFGSDAPWSSAKTEVEHIQNLPIPEKDKEAILYGNAKGILGI